MPAKDGDLRTATQAVCWAKLLRVRFALYGSMQLSVPHRKLIPLTQVHLYVVGAAHEAGRRFCEDCSA